MVKSCTLDPFLRRNYMPLAANYMPLVAFHYIQKDQNYSKTCLKRPLKKKTKIGFQYQLLLNAGQKYCRMLQWKHSAILLTFFKLPKMFALSIFEWLLKTGFTVNRLRLSECNKVSLFQQSSHQIGRNRKHCF